MNINRSLGSIFIVAGTTLGGSMLAMPIVTAGAGLVNTVFLLLLMWLVMVVAAFLLLDVNLAFEGEVSFFSMAQKSLGRFGQLAATLIVLFLLYSLTSAYVSAGTSLLSYSLQAFLNISVSNWLAAVLFTFILGFFVVWKTASVDVVNRLLLGAKFLLFALMAFPLLEHVNAKNFQIIPDSARYLFYPAPIIFTAFGFHGSIPAIVKYAGPNRWKLRMIFLVGSGLALLIYLLWVVVTLGVVPRTGAHSFYTMIHGEGSIPSLLEEIIYYSHSGYIKVVVDVFADLAISTSFLGVTLGLYDFFKDVWKKYSPIPNTTLSTVCTYLPPIIFALLYPQGFILALSYASVALSLLAIILTVAMIVGLRVQSKGELLSALSKNNLLLLLMAVAGFTVIVLQFLSQFRWLPKF